MAQYRDFWHRAHRLEPAHRAYLSDKPAPLDLVTNEDMSLYLNWMCWKFHANQRINNYIMVGVVSGVKNCYIMVIVVSGVKNCYIIVIVVLGIAI